MAGPGGGPPRKSHTKSRKGCKTCKKRHIRCDENFPQCRNCTKHNCRCDYMDNSLHADHSPSLFEGPNLLWTPAIEQEVAEWQNAGVFPFDDLDLKPSGHFMNLSWTDLRLLHHLLTIYREIRSLKFEECTIWVQDLPRFLDVSVDHSFVMDSLLSFSVMHLAWMTKCPMTKNLAFHYREVALKALHDAIGNFSSKNSNGVLAASILLSWQASNWEDWMSLIRGISTFVESVYSWNQPSSFLIYIEKYPALFRSSHGFSPARSIDNESLHLFNHMLQKISSRLPRKHPLYSRLKEIVEFALDIQSCSATMHHEQLFHKLQPLRAWLFWMPVKLTQIEQIDTLEMMLLTQLYTAAIAIDLSIPGLGGAALGALTTRAVEQLDEKIRQDNFLVTATAPVEELEEMMQVSRFIHAKYQFETSKFQSPLYIQG